MILTQVYTLKEDSVVLPTTYLGADVHQHMLNSTVDLETIPWSMSSDTYIKRALADEEQDLDDISETLVKQKQPICGDYHPELDSSPLLTIS
jgi:hypothetical protein